MHHSMLQQVARLSFELKNRLIFLLQLTYDSVRSNSYYVICCFSSEELLCFYCFESYSEVVYFPWNILFLTAEILDILNIFRY